MLKCYVTLLKVLQKPMFTSEKLGFLMEILITKFFISCIVGDNKRMYKFQLFLLKRTKKDKFICNLSCNVVFHVPRYFH